MIIGFTGTREGMTEAQKLTFENLLISLTPTEFHHGDCVGADSDAHDIATKYCPTIVIHPPVDSTHRANRQAQVILSEKTHFARNRDIVKGCNLLIATPLTAEHQERGGTWYTIDYAEKISKSTIIINPDGSLNTEKRRK